MLSLDQLSKIGFGGYRIDQTNKEHASSLHLSISGGCTLIETASNYRGGRSERLIGEVTASTEEEVFVISKTGYVHGKEQQEVIDFFAERSSSDSLHEISQSFYYSIAPAYLDRQLSKSLKNLKKVPVDAYLLHNPEYLLQGPNGKSTEYLYDSIKKAFTFLEEKVADGSIRYYGISSNTLALPASESFVDIEKVLEIAKNISENHHFKFIEFPFNLLERDALLEHWDGVSLLERAHQEDLICLGNRPFNANGTEGPVRLATYADEISHIREEDHQAFDLLKEDIRKTLAEHAYDGAVEDFEVIQFLTRSWKDFRSSEQRDQVINKHLIPLLNQIYEVLPKSYETFSSTVDLFLKHNITIQAEKIRDDHSHLLGHKHKELTQSLCEYYLQCGIDVILVGMRSPKYVDQLSYLFN